MALTKATYSMIEGAVANVLDFGADPTGAVSSTAAFQAAIDSLTNGGSYITDVAISNGGNIVLSGTYFTS